MTPSPRLSPRSLAALEFPQALALIAELASTDVGRQRMLSLSPVDRERLDVRRDGYEEVALLAAEELPVPSIEEPLIPLAAELGRPRPEIDGMAMLAWARLLAVSMRIAARVRASEGGLARLREAVDGLEDLAWLAQRIESSLDDRGEVRDDATPRLGKLRRRIAGRRQAAYSGLRGLLEAQGELFSEDTVPLHNGRLVVMLRSSDRGRIDGLVHGSSSSGRSLYFEPLAVVDSNNALQEAIGEEEAERRRVLVELREALQSESEALQAHLELVAAVDVQQAAWRFAETCDGRLAELSVGEVRLAGGRHPLLDPKTVELRRRALGAVGHEGDVTPLDLTLGESDRVLVVTGPNAGGKTVALKTVGLLVALHQSGLPVPVEAGTRLPVTDALVAVVGDEQDLMRDRSTFSGRLLRLEEAWSAAGPRSLVLLDELGSGTDPQEGAALALGLMERLAAEGSIALVTTHLLELASAAIELDGAACAAMEFDRDTGRPTYRLIPGPPGASEAIALARQLGLPEEWLERATELVGPEHRSLSQMLAEVEAVRAEVENERLELAKARRAVERERQEAEADRVAFADERREIDRRQRAELKAFRRQVRERLEEEIETLREALAKGRRRGLAGESVERLFKEAPEPPVESEPGPPIAVGSRVRHGDYAWEGVVEKLDGDAAEVIVHGKRLQCAVDSLIALEEEPTPHRPKGRVSVEHEARDVPRELKLLGRRVEEALDEIDAYLDRAVLAGQAEVRLIHGHGSGRLREAVREFLAQHPSVRTFRAGGDREGGDGATVVTLRL